MTPPPPSTKDVFGIPNLLQEDVFVDHSLVPLRVQASSGMFGPPLVFSTGGGTHHNETWWISQSVASTGGMWGGGSGWDAHCLKGNKGLRAWTAGLQCRDRLQKSPNSCF